jgi:hypothetical protein
VIRTGQRWHDPRSADEARARIAEACASIASIEAQLAAFDEGRMQRSSPDWRANANRARLGYESEKAFLESWIATNRNAEASSGTEVIFVLAASLLRLREQGVEIGAPAERFLSKQLRWSLTDKWLAENGARVERNNDLPGATYLTRLWLSRSQY